MRNARTAFTVLALARPVTIEGTRSGVGAAAGASLRACTAAFGRST